MARYRSVSGVVAVRPRFFGLSITAKRGKRRTEPDLDLIKQMEQVRNVGFRQRWFSKDRPGVLRDSEHGNHGAVV
jgi:hypothetical protein